MNFLKLSFLLMLAVAFFSCDDDDETKTCTQSDWIGSYTGTIDCDGETADVTVVITESGSEEIVVKYDYTVESVTISSEYDPLKPDNCNYSESSSAGGISGSVKMNLDGDQLTIEEVLSDGTTTATCNLNTTRM